MKAYRFTLATVMRIRELEERLARERLMSAQRELRHSQNAYRCAHQALTDWAPPSSATSVEELRWRYDQSTRLAETVRAHRDELLAAAARRDEAATSWTLAGRRAEVLDRLDAGARAAWRTAAQREEVAEADNLTSARHSWNAGRS